MRTTLWQPPALGHGATLTMSPMTELPASVRLALWVTAAWKGDSPSLTVEQAVERAHPDIDHVAGDLDRLALWHELGEQALFVALPRSGDLTSLPGMSSHVRDLAVESGEAVYAAGLGSVLIPRTSTFGSATDSGWRIDWSAHDADPVPTHRIEQLDIGTIERDLKAGLADLTTRLEEVGAPSWASTASTASMAAAMDSAAEWAVPDLPPRVRRTIGLAADIGTVVNAAHAGDHVTSGAVTAASATGREWLLRDVAALADRALAQATNVGVMTLAGWRPAR